MQALVGILAALAVAPGPAEIAFESDGRIWSSRADGSERGLLVDRARGELLSEPAWSPDGSALAYVRAAGEESGQLMLRDATGTRALTPERDGVFDVTPKWSPDGATVAFSRFAETRRNYSTQIVTHAVATGAERVVAATDLFPRLDQVGEPAWSPDGTTLGYTHTSLDRRHYFRHAIRTIPATGGYSRLLLREAHSLAWSPDGRRVAFASVRDRNGGDCGSDECWYAGELYTAAADGTGATRVTRNRGEDGVPAWSPDGSRILFTSDRNLPGGDAAEVYSVAADGGCLTWLTNGTPPSGSATWRPGSGSEFGPGSCDPNARPARVGSPPPPPVRDRLWLGARHRGLLLSQVDRRHLSYADCARFDPRRCAPTIELSTEPACRLLTFRGLTESPYRLVRRRGALVALSPETDAVRVFSGHAATTIFAARGGARGLLRRLRPLDAAQPPPRLEPPRIPRQLARRLEAPSASVGARRLRRALRAFGPYRFSSCKQ